MRTRSDLESIHRFSSKHRDLLGASRFACCFYCKSRFSPAEIEEWIDGGHVETGDAADGITALCPRCGIDAVLPSAAPVHWDDFLLDEMNEYWF